LPYLANNMEFSSFYFHGANATDIFWGVGGYVYGETLLRAVISPFIYASIFDGFQSSIDIYTNIYDPSFRHIGGSYPWNMFSEVFMNFGVISIAIFPLLCVILDKIYFAISRIENGIARFGLLGGFMF